MKIQIQYFAFTGALLLANLQLASAQSVPPAVQTKVNARVKAIQTWAAAPAIVQAVKAHNANLPADQAAMNQAKWKNLSVLSPFVRALTKNAAAQLLKSKRTPDVAEAFLCGADGLKVAFLNKPSNWSHKGSAKFEVPMTGKTWQGKPELDESSGQQEIQVSVPVLAGGKPIGVLVVGLSVSKLDGK